MSRACDDGNFRGIGSVLLTSRCCLDEPVMLVFYTCLASREASERHCHWMSCHMFEDIGMATPLRTMTSQCEWLGATHTPVESSLRVLCRILLADAM
jgi:hypothetical protein